MAYIAGQYTATFNSLAIGQTAEGFKFEFELFKRLIMGDALAEGPQDAVNRGVRCAIEYSILNFNGSASLTCMWPLSATFLDAGVTGRLDSALWHSLILTALSGTPAAVAAAPATLTLPNTILHENYPVELLFEPDLRVIPMRQRVYPNGSNVFGTQT